MHAYFLQASVSLGEIVKRSANMFQRGMLGRSCMRFASDDDRVSPVAQYERLHTPSTPWQCCPRDLLRTTREIRGIRTPRRHPSRRTAGGTRGYSNQANGWRGGEARGRDGTGRDTANGDGSKWTEDSETLLEKVSRAIPFRVERREPPLVGPLLTRLTPSSVGTTRPPSKHEPLSDEVTCDCCVSSVGDREEERIDRLQSNVHFKTCLLHQKRIRQWSWWEEVLDSPVEQPEPCFGTLSRQRFEAESCAAPAAPYRRRR